MNVPVPQKPKIYHIVHIDRLRSIVENGFLFSDAIISRNAPLGTTIGMCSIKQRRMSISLTSHPGLCVGECVPFYFCPRSIMLYIISQRNHPDLAYKGGQEPIIHLEADLYETVAWAQQNNRRWAFTLSNAGSYFFEDRCDLGCLNEIDWNAVQTHYWGDCKEGKQAEFSAGTGISLASNQNSGCLFPIYSESGCSCIERCTVSPQSLSPAKLVLLARQV